MQWFQYGVLLERLREREEGRRGTAAHVLVDIDEVGGRGGGLHDDCAGFLEYGVAQGLHIADCILRKFNEDEAERGMQANKGDERS